jgi:hypothetical protein
MMRNEIINFKDKIFHVNCYVITESLWKQQIKETINYDLTGNV